MTPKPPTLLVVSGLPASGKTTLGTALARQLGWPLVSKDEYKEILHDHLPALTRAEAGPLSFEIMYHVAGTVLAAGGSAVLETHFYLGVSEPKIRALTEASGASVLQVYCSAPLPELQRRHDARVALGEHPHIHQTYSMTELPPRACTEPLALDGPLLRLETTVETAQQQAWEWLQGQLET
ncbi:ATP-binding protein [Deinococcus sp. KNUC1210]|uniref:AAA family ATPase n=1 Tax=Deinococcus sp. KNUC1210 TaxID=2917691 RepID=UPI001EF0FBEE|nr:ATP-binding protein [Deinococcus sp. KNUC1210]ULH15472.1 ATP-binding protein [Deinococcus sp. KNUC1210]